MDQNEALCMMVQIDFSQMAFAQILQLHIVQERFAKDYRYILIFQAKLMSSTEQ